MCSKAASHCGFALYITSTSTTTFYTRESFYMPWTPDSCDSRSAVLLLCSSLNWRGTSDERFIHIQMFARDVFRGRCKAHASVGRTSLFPLLDGTWN